MFNSKLYPHNTVEHQINKVLVPLIIEIKERMYTPEFKSSPEFSSVKTELEVLGIIISKYCEWDGTRIETVTRAAFQDSNFQPEEFFLAEQ